MKIYCIKIDTVPFRPEVLDIAKIVGGTLTYIQSKLVLYFSTIGFGI